MPYQYIRSITIFTDPGAGTYICRYDPNNELFEVIYQGSGQQLYVLTEQQLGAPADTIIDAFCVGTTKHVLAVKTTHPFLYVTKIYNSTACGFVPPPQPSPNPEPVPPPPPGTVPEQIVYQIQFQNYEKQMVFVWIYDMNTFAPNARPKIFDLKTAQGMYPDKPFVVRTIDNDEDKFKAIRAKEAIIQFYSTSKYDIHTFASGDDKRWYVKAFINDEVNTVFHGYLLTSDLSQPYQPNPNVVTLTATDGLAALKDTALVNGDGKNPKGKFRIVDYINYALRSTKLNLPLRIVHNLHEETPLAYLPWHQCMLDAKTFEAEVNESEDAYTVLEKILGHDCFLHQHAGAWWIQRIDEMDGQRRVFYYDYASNFGGIVNLSLDHEVGPGKEIIHVQEDQRLSYEQPYKKAKLVFNYEYPEELLCNIDFERGSFLSPMSQITTKEVEGRQVTVTTDYYRPECWTMKKNMDYSGTPTTMAATKYIYEDGYLKEKYLVVFSPPSQSFEFLESESAIVEERDKVDFSVSYRLANNIDTNGFVTSLRAFVRLLTTDGRIFMLQADGSWKLTPNMSNGQTLPVQWNTDADDETEWKSLSVQSKAVPAAGELKVSLMAMDVVLEDVYYKDLKLQIQPFINGSYTEFRGHYNQYSHATKDAAIYEEEVYMGEAPRKSMKGHLFTTGNNSAKRFFDFRDGINLNDARFFGKWQARAVFNQYNRFFTVLEGSMQGLVTPSFNVPDCAHLYQFTDQNKAVNNKMFMLLSFEQDYYTCEWNGVFIELFDSIIGKRDNDAWEFRYLGVR